MHFLARLLFAAMLPTSLAFADDPPADAKKLSIESIVALVPADVALKKGGNWQPVPVSLATQAMRTNGMGKPAEFKLKVAVLEPHRFNGHAICIHSSPTPIKINGESVPYKIYAYFDPDTLAGLGSVRVGDTITISGVINKADIELKGKSATLICELLRARLVPPPPKK
jgi:hypothetical protein